jgi:ABC-type lipopolysaccharide export system ATPase subunit
MKPQEIFQEVKKNCGSFTYFSDSKFVLLDEPFNGLSPKMTNEMQKLIKEQSKRKE